jgi:hypothetical protein
VERALQLVCHVLRVERARQRLRPPLQGCKNLFGVIAGFCHRVQDAGKLLRSKVLDVLEHRLLATNAVSGLWGFHSSRPRPPPPPPPPAHSFIIGPAVINTHTPMQKEVNGCKRLRSDCVNRKDAYAGYSTRGDAYAYAGCWTRSGTLTRGVRRVVGSHGDRLLIWVLSGGGRAAEQKDGAPRGVSAQRRGRVVFEAGIGPTAPSSPPVVPGGQEIRFGGIKSEIGCDSLGCGVTNM